MRTITLIAILVGISISGNAQNVTGVLNSYLHLKDALVKSDSKATSESAAAFEKEITTVPAFKQNEKLSKAVQKMVKAGDIEKQRAAFAEVSPAFWQVLKGMSVPQDVYYQYCPMKKSYWVSAEATIKNPYYGAAMLGCGNVADKKLK